MSGGCVKVIFRRELLYRCTSTLVLELRGILLRSTRLIGQACHRISESTGARASALGIVGILVVIVIVVSAAMFYFYVLLPGSVEVSEARLSKARAVGGDVWEVMVESVNPTRSLYYYLATLDKDDSFVITLEPLTGSSPGIAFIDHDGDWRLSSDDYFRLICESKSSYSFTLVYLTDVETLDTVEWET